MSTQATSLENQNIEIHVNSLLSLIQQEKSIPNQDTSYLEASRDKLISCAFDIVFVGAFSAGKSMLINAVLGQELLYSSQGHTTSTECRIQYAEPDEEKVVLEFMSRRKIQERINALCRLLEFENITDINQSEDLESLVVQCNRVIDEEPGKSRSKRARQAGSLIFLIEGFRENTKYIDENSTNSYSMEQLNLENLGKAVKYAQYGENAAVLERIQYYLNHPLLKNDNILVDTPGIDAPVKQDAQITYDKIEKDPDTSAIVCVLKAGSTGDPEPEEMELLEKLRGNPSIRDRVFYVFNRIDETWGDPELRSRLENLIASDFRDARDKGRVFKTSALLSFYANRIKQDANQDGLWGLNSIFLLNHEDLDDEDKTPAFVKEFNAILLATPEIRGPGLNPFDASGLRDNPSSSKQYLAILNHLKTPVLDKLIQHSGIENKDGRGGFNSAITNYLQNEKRPELFVTVPGS